MEKVGNFFFVICVQPAYLLWAEFADAQFYGATSNTLSRQNRGVEFGNSYIKINRAKAVQLEREKSKAETGWWAV